MKVQRQVSLERGIRGLESRWQGDMAVVIDNFDDLPLAKCWEYRFVEELVVKRISPVGFLDIKMVLTKQVPASSERITVHFDQCVEFRPDRMFILSGLDLQIEPKRSAFFEEVRFRIFDRENDAFEFLCGGFIFEIANVP
jgi:hypothetical protein